MIKAVILAGGLGTRMREETEHRPKPLVEIGGRPVLWHIMKNLSSFGISEFIIATGYKANMIKDYFLNYESRNSDFTIELGGKNSLTFHNSHNEKNWKVTVAFTGEHTLTGGRIKRVSKYLNDSPFLVTYGDGLSNINIKAILENHIQNNSHVTLAAVQPTSRFGVMELNQFDEVLTFAEKPKLEGWINIGFFIMNPLFLDYLDFDGALEEEPLMRIAKEGKLSAYRHEGFWQPMDTYREYLALNKLWDQNLAPWKNW